MWISIAPCGVIYSIILNVCTRSRFSKRELSWCQLCCHWWHRRLSSRQPPVPPMTTKLASWRYSFLVVIPAIIWNSCNLLAIGFRSRFSQCADYMRFNEKSFCFRWQETTKPMLFGNSKTSNLVILCDLRYLTGNVSQVMTNRMGVQRKLHRFAYLIVQIILCL